MQRMLKYLAYAAALLSGVFSNVPEAVRWLLLIMALDIITGTIRAGRSGQITSDAAWKGGAKKVGTLVIIGLVLILEKGLNLVPGLPLVTAVTGYYIYTEAISVITNAAAIGVPIPDVLANALAGLNPDKLDLPPVIAAPAPADPAPVPVNVVSEPPQVADPGQPYQMKGP